MKKKLFVIIAVVVAVMALGISSALAFGGPDRDDATTRYGRNNDCDGTCEALEPQDGTGNQYGLSAGDAVCDGTCDGDRLQLRDGTGNQNGLRAGDADNDGICDYGNTPRSGGQCGRFR